VSDDAFTCVEQPCVCTFMTAMWLLRLAKNNHSVRPIVSSSWVSSWSLWSRHRDGRLFASSSSAPTPQTTSDTPPDAASSKVQQLVDEIIHLNMIEVKQLTQQLKDRLGVSDMPMMAAPVMSMQPSAPGAASEPKEEAPKKEEKTEFALKLEAFEAAKKIQIIKEVRALAGLGLKEAKEMVEGVPKIIKTGVSKEEGEKMRDKLKELGATVVLE
jgi:large subunit ribosomal protein L7/L12